MSLIIQNQMVQRFTLKINQNTKTLDSQKITLKTKLFKISCHLNLIKQLISTKYLFQIKFHKSKMKRVYQLRDIIAKNNFDYNTSLRSSKKIRRHMNEIQKTFLLRLELGVSHRSLLPLIHFQNLENSLLTQIIKRGPAFLFHQMGECY